MPTRLQLIKQHAQRAVARNAKAIQCTAESPMPKDRDQLGQVWFHQGAVPDGPSKNGYTPYRCPHCDHVFITQARKIDFAEELRIWNATHGEG